MKSFQMKALALAVLGLAGFGVAGSAMAACTNPTPFAAWSSGAAGGAQFGGTIAAANGLHSTSCSMASTYTSAGPSASLGQEAIVYDQSPQKEQTYRFRFYIDPTAVAAHLSTIDTTAIFGAQSNLKHGATKANNNMVRMYLIGTGDGTTVQLRTFAACTTGDNALANRCRASTDLTLPPTGSPGVFTGGVRIEGQLIVGGTGAGKVNIWIGSNTGAPDQVINVDNLAWGTASTDGVKTANLGLFQGSSGFFTDNQNKAVLFDEFDSRRQTPIGP